MQQMLVNLASRYPELDSELTDFNQWCNMYTYPAIYMNLPHTYRTPVRYIQRTFIFSTRCPMLRALDYIEHHYMDKLTVESIAQGFTLQQRLLWQKI